MPIVINGSGTVTGISVGGLPDGCIDRDTLATTARPDILQVKTVEQKANQTCGSINTYTDITGLAVAITPRASSSKIYISACLAFDSYENYCYARVVKEIGGTTSALSDLTNTDITGSQVDTHFGNLHMTSRADNYNYTPTQFTGIHSPSTTSEITFKIQWMILGSYTGYLNRANTLGTTNANGNCISTLTVMEVAG